MLYAAAMTDATDDRLAGQYEAFPYPKRDPREHTVSTVFIASARGTPVGGDDAASCIVATPDALPAPLVFDHATIVADYVAYRATGKRPPPRR